MKVFYILTVLTFLGQVKIGKSQIPVKIQLDTIELDDGNFPKNFTAVGDVLIFTYTTCDYGSELWYYKQGVCSVIDLNPGIASSGPIILGAENNLAYIKCKDPNGVSNHVFLFDATTMQLTDVTPNGFTTPITNPNQRLFYNGEFYITLTDSNYYKQLCKFSGGSATQLTFAQHHLYLSDFGLGPDGFLARANTDSDGKELWKCDGTSFFQIADIFPGPSSSNPSKMTYVGDTAYFIANDGLTGAEIWMYDGVNVSIVEDINPGSGGSNIYCSWEDNWHLFRAGNSIYINAYSPNVGQELRVIQNGSLTTFDINISASSSANYFTEYNGNALFFADDGINGNELWISDGYTVSLLQDINPGVADSYIFPVYNGFNLEINGEKYLRADHNTFGPGLWKTDGNTVSMEADFPGNFINDIFNFEDTIYIVGDNELYKYNGVTYEEIIINPSGLDNPQEFVQFSDTIFFSATNGVDGNEPFLLNSQSADMIVNGDEDFFGFTPNNLDSINGQLFMFGKYQAGGDDIAMYDGMSAVFFDTNLVIIEDESFHYVSNGYDQIVFAADDGINGVELWAFDGDSIFMVMDINSGLSSSNPENFCLYNQNLYFSAHGTNSNIELWKYDGSSVNIVEDFAPGYDAFTPDNLYVFNGELYFSGTMLGTTGNELYKYDESSISLVSDIYPGTTNGLPKNFVEYQGELYFSANSGNGYELHKYDGVSVTEVQDVWTGSGGSFPVNLNVYNGELIYAGKYDGVGQELLKYDGTAISVVEDIYAGPDHSLCSNFIEFNGKLYFIATDELIGSELHEYDGFSVSCPNEILPGPGSSGISDLFIYAGDMYFGANNGSFGQELWKFNGVNVFQVADINIDGSSFPSHFFEFDNKLYFQADGTCSDPELWFLEDCSPTTSTLDTTVCDELTFNGSLFTSGGTKYVTLLNSNSCDSIITINLTLNSSAWLSSIDTACSSYVFYGDTLTNSGLYTEYLTSSAGCDSVVELNLIIELPFTDTLNLVGCDSVIYNGNTYFNSGFYYDSLNAFNGCDSVIVLEVLIETLDPFILESNNTLYGYPIEADQYQWVNCDSSFAFINGGTNSSYSPNANGNYAVILNDGVCTDTSNCYEFGFASFGVNTTHDIQIFPNPTASKLSITNISESVEFKIYDLEGRLLYVNYGKIGAIEIDVSSFESGIYVIEIIDHLGINRSSFVKL